MFTFCFHISMPKLSVNANVDYSMEIILIPTLNMVIGWLYRGSKMTLALKRNATCLAVIPLFSGQL